MQNMMLVALVVAGMLFLLRIQTEYAAFQQEAEVTRQSFEKSQKELIREQVTGVAEYINYRKSQTEMVLRKTVRDRVYEAHRVASHIFQVNSRTKSPQEIQQLIKDALRHLRFNEGRGYYFIFNLTGIEELFADRPELEGQNMLPVQGAQGEFVVRDMIDLVRDMEEGFYEYTWTKPGEQTNTFRKTAFVKLFQPYDWVIGTGEYVEDVREDIQKEVLERLVGLKFGREGYFFGSKNGGIPLFTNGKITKGTANIWNLTDPNGVRIIQEYERAVQAPEGGFVRYSWPKLDRAEPAPKISYVVGIPDWQWIIGAGVYLDTVEEEIAQRKELLLTLFLHKSLVGIVALLTLLAVIFFWVRQLSEAIRNSLEAFIQFCQKAAKESANIDPASLKFQEFHDIASSMNTMLEGRRRDTEALIASEEKYRTLFTNMVQGVFYQLADGTLTDVNSSALDILGLSREQLLGRTSMHPEWRVIKEDGTPLSGAEHPSMQALLSGKSVLDFVAGVFNPEKGSFVWISINAIPQFRSGEDKPYQVFVTIHDITDRRQSEKALRESEEQFRTLAALAPVGIYLTSPDGRCQYVNPLWCEMAGLRREEALGDGWVQGIHPEDRDIVLARWQEMIKKGENWGLEYRLQTRDGKITWVQGLATAQRDGVGNTVRYIGINIDITDRKNNEYERQRFAAQLQQAQRLEAIGTLAGGIAHDFNNILGAILGYAEMARDDSPPGSNVAGDLEQILKAGNRAKDLVAQILTFSRQAETERIQLQPAQIIKEAIKLLRPSIPTTIEITMDIDMEAGTVFADPTQVHQILINLCTNAYHAMEENGGLLAISLKKVVLAWEDLGKELSVQPGEFVRLSVSDTGSGILPEVRARIFDPYFTTKETGKGSGMGLAIVHGIVKSYDGFVTCCSTPGEGTVFHVFLPVIDSRSVAETEVAGTLPLGKERILLIDDERILAEMGKTMLERLGYSVTVKNNSFEALAVFQSHPELFDLVITDQTMPGMTGVDLARRMLQIRPQLPIILCTGFSTQVSEEKVKAIGISAFALKPLTKRDIAELIRKVLAEKGS